MKLRWSVAVDVTSDADRRRDGEAGTPVSRELGFCPCCGYRTLSPGEPGSHEVCPVCGWLDDPVGFHNPQAHSTYNHVSLAEARENVREYGSCLPGVLAGAAESDQDRDPNYPYDDAGDG